MDEVLTMEEIKARYAPNWVLIGDPQADEHHHVLAGKVVVRGPAARRCMTRPWDPSDQIRIPLTSESGPPPWS